MKNLEGKPNFTGFAKINLNTGAYQVMKLPWSDPDQAIVGQSILDVIELGNDLYVYMYTDYKIEDTFKGLIRLDNNLNLINFKKEIPEEWTLYSKLEPHPTRTQDVIISNRIDQAGSWFGVIELWEKF